VDVIARGVILFLAFGACLGASAGRLALGAVGAALVGLIAAVGWYAVAPVIGYWGAMFAMWFGLWLMLGVLTVKVLQRRTGAAEIAVRSVLAAIGSGLAFYAISGIWQPFDPRGWDYAIHFVSWTIAFLPAFAALLVRNTREQRR
jgi:hypothetical protein